jgi:DNA-binding transcriptional ArsR family regulator
MSSESAVEKARDLHGSSDGLVELLTARPSHRSDRWLDEIMHRCVNGHKLCSAQPFVVRLLFEALVHEQGSPWRRVRRYTRLALLHWLAQLASDSRLSPTHGRVGPGPAGAGAIQSHIKIEIKRASPALRVLFDAFGWHGKRAASLAATAARVGERLYSDAELR